MKIGLEIKIDVKKINKDLLYEGQKGTYLSLTGFVNVDEKDQYGNSGFVTQSKPKEQEEQMPILGNSKVFWTDFLNQNSQVQNSQNQDEQQWQPASQATQQVQPIAKVPDFSNDIDDDIPFNKPEDIFY